MELAGSPDDSLRNPVFGLSKGGHCQTDEVNMASRLLTIPQFCGEFEVSRSTAYRLRDSGEVPHVKIGRAVRIRREDAERWYESLRDDAAND